MNSVPVLKVRDLRTQFFTSVGIIRAVDGVNFSVMPGEILGVVGESGSGKSVMALSILRLVPYPARITSGEILLNNRNLLKLSGEEMRKVRGDQISLVFQDPTAALNPVLTIGWQLREALQAHRRISNNDARQKGIKALMSVGLPDPELRYSSYPYELSGGMNQRTAIAMSVINDPVVLIADEPTTGLDVTIQAQILELLKLLTQKHGMAVVFITHNLGVIANICDRVVVMYAGEILEQAYVHDLFSNPLHPYTWMLLRSLPRVDHYTFRLPTIPGILPDMSATLSGCRFFSRCPLKEAICERHPMLEKIELNHWSRCWLAQRGERFKDNRKSSLPVSYRIKVMPWRWDPNSQSDQIPILKRAVQSQVVVHNNEIQNIKFLDLQRVVKHFSFRQGFFGKQKIVHAVDGVNLHVMPGESLGIVGESGCGKSTLARLMVGLYRPTSGVVLVDGYDLASITPDLIARRHKLQILFQDQSASLNPRICVGKSIKESLEVQDKLGEVEIHERMLELLTQVGLQHEIANHYPHELSGGQKQRICIARALMANPRLIVVDEAVSSLDVSLQAQILNLLQDIQDQLGVTYVIISHDLAIVQSVSTRIGVMYMGKIVELAPEDEFSSNHLHPYSIALHSAMPIPDPKKERKRERIILQGDVPSPFFPPRGCRFHTRCPLVQAICKEYEPPMIQYLPEHWVACHLAGMFDEGEIIAPISGRGKKT